MRLAIDPKSYRHCLEALATFPGRLRFKHMRIALNAGAGVIKNIAAHNAPKETKALGQSIGVKVRIPDASYNSRHHGKPAYAVIGARRKFAKLAANIKGTFKAITVKRIAKINNKIHIRRPARYAHLAGPGRKSTFMHRAAVQGAEHAQRRVIAKLQSGTYEEARILAAQIGL